MLLTVGLVGTGGAQAPATPASNTSWATTVSTQSLPSPFVLAGTNSDYLYTSGGSGSNAPVRPFKQITNLPTTPIQAMPKAPSWSTGGMSSPDVRQVGRTYVMWFSAQDKLLPRQPRVGLLRCLGAATSSSPTGPFTPVGGAPTTASCQSSENGQTSPRTLTVGSFEYLYWKGLGNITGKQSNLYEEQLNSAGTAFAAHNTPSVILTDNLPWQSSVVGSPDVLAARNGYFLFYTGNGDNTHGSGIGIAACTKPTPSCTSSYGSISFNGPWIGPSETAPSPNNESLFTQGGNTWVLYSAAVGSSRLAISQVASGSNGPYLSAVSALPGVGSSSATVQGGTVAAPRASVGGTGPATSAAPRPSPAR